MGFVTIDDTILTGIADAIRQCNGETVEYKPSEMPEAIKTLELSNEQEILDKLVSGTITEYSSDTVTTVGIKAFDECASLTTVDLPVCTYVDNNAFTGCTSLTTVDLPVCKELDNQTFTGCTSLTTVDLPVCETIGAYTFSDCTALTTIDLPKATKIWGYAFGDCEALTTVILRNSTMTRGDDTAFNNTPIAGYVDGSNGELGYIYVPSALIDTYKANDAWSPYANQFRAIEDYPEVCG